MKTFTSVQCESASRLVRQFSEITRRCIYISYEGRLIKVEGRLIAPARVIPFLHFGGSPIARRIVTAEFPFEKSGLWS